MAKAWIENDTIRDVFAGDPFTIYHPDIAARLNVDVPDDVRHGARLVDGVWVNPPISEVVVPVVPAVPDSITRRQALLALSDAGLLDTAASTIAAIPGAEGVRARIEWEAATSFDRRWPMLVTVAGLLGLDDAQLDALFVAGAKL